MSNEQKVEDNRVEKLVQDLVDLAIINNQVISSAKFGIDDVAKVQLAIEMNNLVLKTYTDLDEKNEEESK